MEAEVKLFTLNCWGLGMGISKHRDERMQDIGLFISQQDYDIVFLQVIGLAMSLSLNICVTSGGVEETELPNDQKFNCKQASLLSLL